MPQNKGKSRRPKRGRQVSLYPLTADQAVWLMFMIGPDEVKKVRAAGRKNGGRFRRLCKG